ncbi:hypothetical protein ACSMXN_20350 [Jatrophihabitans sp. DSM 45814]
MPTEPVMGIALAWPGAGEFDVTLPFPVIRRHGYLLFRDLRRIPERHRADVGWITAIPPFGLQPPMLRRTVQDQVVASTHGKELGWLRAWPTRIAVGRMAGAVDTVTYLSETTHERLHPGARPAHGVGAAAGGIERFNPGVGVGVGAGLRERLGVGDDPWS